MLRSSLKNRSVFGLLNADVATSHCPRVIELFSILKSAQLLTDEYDFIIWLIKICDQMMQDFSTLKDLSDPESTLR